MTSAASSSSNTTSVQVAVRIRPANGHDALSIPTRFQRTVINASPPSTVVVEPSTIPPSSTSSTGSQPSAANNPLAKRQTFAFDQVHSQESTQHSIFTSTAAPLVARFLQGFNCTVLAYGQTSSGKTYTMTGVDLDSDPNDPANGMGIIPRAVATVFAGVQQLKQERGNAWKCSVKGSYIEIYNEDLIDLLAEEGGRRDVQIREEKDGTILWSGLREVPVRNTLDVMQLIKQGSSIRRTNETDMNAQSSRSHAIFSLTLTQKKYTGTTPLRTNGVTSGRTSPMPPTSPTAVSATPSRLGRPASMYGSTTGSSRVGSPTFGRPPTPSFASAMNRASLRPGSSMALHSDGQSPGEEASGDGSWVTVISKFHFVDLAGSERLKRTAAAGDRIKEGISINSGLLALGNVISALGDPSRSRSLAPGAGQHIHVPYRDSKLTRLLQDSLGGNAHTLMIACVSPAEWNAAETVNTLKYANRARNIKNRAEVKEKEEGWDDLEWLQGMILKLRKEVKALKEGGAIGSIPEETAASAPPTPSGGANKMMMQKYHELQVMHEELRMRYTQANEEVRKTRQELEERPAVSHGGGNNLKRYEEIVAPVIEQYEKTISAMEAELKLNRTALAHTNEMYQEQEAELEALKERRIATEAYVEELRARVSKLVERESSTETYVRDLEQKLKAYSDSSLSSEESITDLRKELAKHKTNEEATASYITDLEARLARSDTDVASLRTLVEKFEADADRKSSEIARLEAKVDELLSGGGTEKDLADWKASLEDRERKVAELERQMEEWQKVRHDTGAERARLGSVVSTVERQQRDLEQELSGSVGSLGFLKPERVDIDGLSLASASETADADDDGNSPLHIDTPGLQHPSVTPPSPNPSVRSFLTLPPEVVREQLLTLRKTHSLTLEELSTVTSKYRDALKEISDLAGQITDVKAQLKLSSGDSSAPGSTAGDVPSDGEPGTITPIRKWSTSGGVSPGSAMGVANGSINRRRRATGGGIGRSDTQSPPPLAVLNANGPTRKLFFKQAASAESLHSRSQSYSPQQQEPSPSLYGARGSPREPYMGRDGVPESLLSPTFPGAPPRLSPLRMSLQLGNDGARSVESLEKEIMRLQEVLKDREAEISVLEKNITAFERSTSPSRKSSSGSLQPTTNGEAMSPDTRARFEELKRSLEVTPDLASPEGGSGEDSLTRLNELMRAMAQKESQHHQAVNALNEELAQVRRQHEQLTDTTREQVTTLIGERDKLRVDLIDSKEQQLTAATQLESLRERERVLLDERRIATEKHANEIAILKAQHDEELARVHAEHAELVGTAAEEHEDAVQYAMAKGRREAEVAAAAQLESTIATLAAEHEANVAKLVEQHENELRTHEVEVEALLARTRADHERGVARLRAEHEDALSARDAIQAKKAADELVPQYEATIKQMEDAHQQTLREATTASESLLAKVKQEHQDALTALEAKHQEDRRARLVEADAALQAARDDHDVVLTKVKAEHDETVARKASEFNQLLQRTKDEHAAHLRQAEIALEGSMSESQTVTANAMRQLQEEHGAALARRDVSAAEDLERLKADHERTLATKEVDHQTRLDKLLSDHATTLAREQDEHAGQVKRLQAEHAANGQDQAESLAQLMGELDSVTRASETTRSNLIAGHEQNLLRLKAEHQVAIAEMQNNLITAQELHRAALEEARADWDQARQAETQRHKASLEDLERLQTSERETLRKAHDLLSGEVDKYKVQLAQAESDKEHIEASRLTDVEDLKTRLATMEEHLNSVMSERATKAEEAEQLRADLAKQQEERAQQASNLDSLTQELERHQSVLGDLQEDLQRAKDAKDTILEERQRQDGVIRDLQAQLAKVHKREGSGDSTPTSAQAAGSRMRPNGIPPAKLPPLTAPPSVPPPPTPTSSVMDRGFPTDASVSSHGTGTLNGRASTSSSNSLSRAGSQNDHHTHTPSTSIAMSPSQGIDPKVAGLIEEQAKHLEEQEAMIKTLNKQLTHCEADLQAHMDLVATLEASLTDSERSLRKARLQSNELVKERDSHQQQINGLRQQVQEAQREASSLRRSVAEEKLSLEHRLEEERKAKERARAQLDSRMEEMSKRKSKFVCL
ncbi:hypothetical protein FRB94_008412 [Tulasnella sp. JGI-2019a]|nr:hypothetical protein FRB94_008412 [Tulasnella sp. JGI-2019a]